MKRTALQGWTGALLCALAMAASAAAPVPFADLARHAQFKQVKISPDGTHIAATTVLASGQTVLSLYDLDTRKAINIAPRGQDDVLDFWWVSPQRVVYNEALHLGGWDQPVPTGELYAVNADGSDAAILYGFRAGDTQAGTNLRRATPQYASAEFLARVEGDPNRILATVQHWDSGGWTEVIQLDVRNGERRTMARGPVPRVGFLADHRGNVRFAMGDDAQGNRQIYLRPAGGGDWALLKEASADRDWPIAFSADDKTVWFTCPGVPEGFGICRFDPATRAMTPVWSNPDVDADGLAHGLARDSVAGIEFTDGRPSVALLDTASPDAKILLGLMQQFPGKSVRFVSGSADGSRTIVLVEADNDPGNFYVYDRAKNQLSPLLPRAQWLKPDQLAFSDPFTFKTRDGLTEQGYVTYPPGKENAKGLPLVVFVHGGPYGIRDTWKFDPYVQALATRGYAVLQVNFRGSGGYGYDFIKTGWLQWGGTMQDDVTDATRWAIAQGIADPNRICIHGGSYGGYAALEGAVKEPNLYKCAIGYVGVYDLRLMYTRGDIPQTIYGKEYLKRVLGTDMDELARRSPVYQLDRLKAKVMLIVGGRDTRVPPVQGETLHRALLQKGIAHEWLYKADESHGFYDEKNIAELFQKVDAFLGANLGPGAQ